MTSVSVCEETGFSCWSLNKVLNHAVSVILKRYYLVWHNFLVKQFIQLLVNAKSAFEKKKHVSATEDNTLFCFISAFRKMWDVQKPFAQHRFRQQQSVTSKHKQKWEKTGHFVVEQMVIFDCPFRIQS